MSKSFFFLVCSVAACGGPTSGGTTTPPNTYSLEIGDTLGGTITATPAGKSYLEGTVVTLTAVADPGFQFTKWNDTSNDSSTTLTITMLQNQSVSATFARVFTLTVLTVGNGTVTPVATTYAEGTNVNLHAIPASGHAVQWRHVTETYPTDAIVTMTADTTVTATFVCDTTCTLTVDLNEPASEAAFVTTPDANYFAATTQVEIAKGTIVSVTAHDAVSTFRAWSGTDDNKTWQSASDCDDTVTMSDDRTITAHFSGSSSPTHCP